ncbi:MAG: hypothetical protein J6K80_09435, partial [Oscillospiraceae bacterium]|nr:hypothetical protein [Oscillospiraceae bacterium]
NKPLKEKADEKKEKEKMWIVVNKHQPLLPFTTADGRIRLYKDSAAAQRYIDHKSEFPLVAMSLTQDQLERCKDIWVKLGIKSIDIYSDDENFITEKTTDTNFIGDMIALLLLRIKQNTVRSDDKNFLKMDFDWLKRELAATPLLVPFNYDNDNRANSAKDTSLHMTDAANRQLSRLLRDENNQPKNPIPSYYGTKLLTGEKFGIIWNGDNVMYYGGMEKSAEAADDDNVNSDQNGPKIMRPFFADNSKTDTHMLAAFTNIRDLRNLYPDKRIAVFSFGELAALSKEGDGIVFDPGSASLSFEMDRTAIEKLI